MSHHESVFFMYICLCFLVYSVLHLDEKITIWFLNLPVKQLYSFNHVLNLLFSSFTVSLQLLKRFSNGWPLNGKSILIKLMF